jgi:hypothetical protein
LFEARHFRRNVVSLDVDVDAALMVHLLDLYDRLVRRSLQHPIIPPRTRVVEVDRTAERSGPEEGGSVYVGGLTVDEDGA